ncbi:MAG: hypothetical protein GX236_04855 [Clostridiaceae bacterium]|nr:hypothetical protein [Clostridiaceae bacterium]
MCAVEGGNFWTGLVTVAAGVGALVTAVALVTTAPATLGVGIAAAMGVLDFGWGVAIGIADMAGSKVTQPITPIY